jgi:hypothetical protein
MWLNRPGPFWDSAGQTEYPLARSRALFPVFYLFLCESAVTKKMCSGQIL